MHLIASMQTLLFFALNVLTPFQVASGNILGTVSDPQGARIPAVRVSLTNSDTGLERTTTTDALGTFGFPRLAPGQYQLTWSVPDFAIESLPDAQVRVGQSLQMDVQLTPVSRQEIVVTNAKPLVDKLRTEQGMQVSEVQISQLPVNERDYLQFALLTPGVTDAAALIDFSLPQAPTSGLSFSGQGGRSNSVMIDGVDNNDGAAGGVRATLGQSAVREFQVKRSNYTAEFGRAGGGVVNIVSKSGTNRFAGSIFGFMHHQSLDARNPFAFGPNGGDIDPPFSRVQAGFTLGGPLVHSHDFFFLSYERLRERESSFSTFLEDRSILEPTESQEELIAALMDASDPELGRLGVRIRNLLTTSEVSNPDAFHLLEANSGVFPLQNDAHKAFLRIDHQSNYGQRFLRVAFADTDTEGDSPGGLKGYSRGAHTATEDWSLVYGDSQFGSSWVNDLRVQLSRRGFRALPIDPYGPELTINGTAWLGRDFYLPSVLKEKRVQALETVTLNRGRHELKSGGEITRAWFDTRTEIFFGGRFVFGESIPLSEAIRAVAPLEGIQRVASELVSSGRPDLIAGLTDSITALQAYNLGAPILYQQGFGNPVTRLSQTVIAGFVQDRFLLTPKLTLNLGLRYEAEIQPPLIPRDWNNLAPRIGFAYSFGPQTVIRGGYGVFYSPVYQAIAFIGTVLDGKRIAQVFLPLDASRIGDSRVGAAEVWNHLKQEGIIGSRTIRDDDLTRLGVEPGRTPPVLFGIADDLVNPYNQQFSFGIEHAWAGRLTADIAWVASRGAKLLRSRNWNLQITGRNAYGVEFGRLDPRVLQDNRVESTGNSIHHGMTATLQGRFSGANRFWITYALSKTIDDTTDFLTDLQPANQMDLENERSLSAFDQRHRLVVASTYDFPVRSGIAGAFGAWRVSPILTMASGRPFNLLLGFDANRDLNANTDRPPSAGRNTGKGPAFMSLDLRLSRSFYASASRWRIEVIAEAFNILNSVNYRRVNNVVGAEPLESFDVHGEASRRPSEPLGFTSAFAPRQVQLGMRLDF